ncbi:MAG: phosphate signaling complex protein PhoU [candidate division Zixibacteria bacterium]|nr:phosphate signaling complex protein PhoU [candidate division Zixibacteria bacterium]
MSRHFEKEIEKLKKKILHLSAMVEESLTLAVKAVTERDSELARQIIDVDDQIDDMEVDVEEECLKILALHQPVAIDLRFIIAVLKINNDLERIGDLAGNIAKRTTSLAQWETREVPYDLPEMLKMAVSMVKKSTDALINMNSDQAREVCSSDDHMDEMHRLAFKAVQEEIRKKPERVEYYILLLSISRILERIADHATNIAEDVTYMVEGEIIRHRGGEHDF